MTCCRPTNIALWILSEPILGLLVGLFERCCCFCFDVYSQVKELIFVLIYSIIEKRGKRILIFVLSFCGFVIWLCLFQACFKLIITCRNFPKIFPGDWVSNSVWTLWSIVWSSRQFFRFLLGLFYVIKVGYLPAVIFLLLNKFYLPSITELQSGPQQHHQ